MGDDGEEEDEEKNIFSEFEDDFLEFEKVKDKLSNRPDLHAFILLDKLVPGKKGMDLISASEHDEYYLSIEPEKLAKVATKDQLRDLHRCGIRHDPSNDSLCVFS